MKSKMMTQCVREVTQMCTMSIFFIAKPTFQIGTSVQFEIIVLKVESLHFLKGFKTYFQKL